jgi:hypothetical protein
VFHSGFEEVGTVHKCLIVVGECECVCKRGFAYPTSYPTKSARKASTRTLSTPPVAWHVIVASMQ